MNLKEAKEMAEREIEIHIPEWSFEFDNAVRRMGCCHYSKKKITLSKKLTLLNDEDKILDTIFHEIAHAICGFKNGHNHVWRAKAKELGACGKRCYSTNVDSPLKVTQPKGKYTLVCLTCGKEYQCWRKKKYESACTICCQKHNGGVYSDKFVLVAKEEKDLEIWGNMSYFKREKKRQEMLGYHDYLKLKQEEDNRELSIAQQIAKDESVNLK